MKGFYLTKEGRKVFFEDIGNAIRNLHPALIGKHIFTQLEALGLRDEFNKAHTGCGLPYSFSDCTE